MQCQSSSTIIMLLQSLGNLSPLSAAFLTIAVSICLTYLISKLWAFWKIPGPWGLPLIGYYPFIRTDFYNHLHELTKKYGDVYTINLAGTNYVYIGNAKVLKEANITRGDDFCYRPNKYSVMKLLVDNGLPLISGDPWSAQRKLFINGLREAGLQTRDRINKGPIADAVASVLEKFHKTNGESFEPFFILASQCDFVLRSVMVGDITEEQVQGIKDGFMKMSNIAMGMNMMMMGPLAEWYYFPRAKGFSQVKEGVSDMKKVLADILKQHQETFDINQEPRDFVDLFIRERAIREKKGDPLAKCFSDDSLAANIRQAYADGTFSVAMFMLSFLWQMSRFREAQDMLYNEIVEVVGTERAPTLDDRSELPKIQSAFKELLRTTKFMTVVPSLEACRDTEINGIRIPKGYVTLVNVWAIQRDPNVYENPYEFDVTRFLPEKGKVDPPITFGVGRRSCVAEVFVMNELFLFVTAILQNFILVPEKEADENKPVLEISQLLSSKLRAIPRRRKDSISS